MSIGVMKDKVKLRNLTLGWSPHRRWVGRGTGTPKDKDEVNRREVCECEGCVCDS